MKNTFGLYYTYLPYLSSSPEPLSKSGRVSLVKRLKTLSEDLHEIVFMLIIEHAKHNDEYAHGSEELPYALRVSTKSNTVHFKLRSIPDDLILIIDRFCKSQSQ